ncbi:xylulokinase [Alginatibacterium sediminis]|uniref:Xylulose kinase n=1 Tax=Alginatibacterium sediminis TaxID=2164068 RepID=A0A420E6L8_9ALTE|nr:xylulokinase [Alginatibacterium sediminis]RKF14280.1 xylulokinase [Alginatibacterium sediminis]
MYIGIDLGTSGVKAVLLSETGDIIDQQSSPLSVSRPQELWSEQAPQDWWTATCNAMQALADNQSLASVKSMGIAGQMHGATLIDKNADIIRPCMLWNDGRSAQQCAEIEAKVPSAHQISGNLVMPGFTAPKVLWVKQNEPENFARIDKVLLPKDYLNFRLSGQFASDMSDAAGTSWLDVEKRDWSLEMLEACGLNRSHMPSLFEGNQITGQLKASLAKRWGMNEVAIVAGGGDNAAGAVGVGIIKPGQAMLSLGTSGVYFAVSNGYRSNPESAVHSFCHALPDTWHLMSVILSAAACLDWVVELTGLESVPEMLKQVEALDQGVPSSVLFLPYLSGERTPHNNPEAKGVFFGMSHETTKLELAKSVLEGVGYAFADGFRVLHESGLKPDEISLIGGGARSAYWRQMLADITGESLRYCKGGEVGPALGAARLAKLGVNPDLSLDDVCPSPELVQIHEVNIERHNAYQSSQARYQELYQRLADFF